jgi:cysteine desulfurase/selenocysteine lyase
LKNRDLFKEIREWFPQLNTTIDRASPVYLDSAATSLKPRQVVEAISEVYLYNCSSVHRGSYSLSARNSERYEAARDNLKHFLNAGDHYDLIFTSGTTDSINLTAIGMADIVCRIEDAIAVSLLEHHSNYCPWRMLAETSGCRFVTIAPDGQGNIDIGSISDDQLSGVRIAAFSQASNVTGVLQDLRDGIRRLRSRGTRVIVDGAQSTPHQPIDIDSLQPDVFVCSAHKMLGPDGIGALLVRKTLLDKLRVVRVGGGMVLNPDKLEWRTGPARFEAGSPNFCGVLGWSKAIELLEDVGMANVRTYVSQLTEYLMEGLKSLSHIRLISPCNTAQNIGIVSFIVEGVHSHDVGAYLNKCAVSVRVGNLCAQPLLKHIGVRAVVRVSIYVYNNEYDIDRLIEGLRNMFVEIRK